MSANALRFAVNDAQAQSLKDGERYYRIELSDGREALIAAAVVEVSDDGSLVAKTDNEVTLMLAPGIWCSAYMCEALLAYDPVSILYLPEPKHSKAVTA